MWSFSPSAFGDSHFSLITKSGVAWRHGFGPWRDRTVATHNNLGHVAPTVWRHTCGVMMGWCHACDIMYCGECGTVHKIDHTHDTAHAT